jgi:cytochrome c2
MSQARILVALAFVASGCQCGTERSARPLSGGNAQLGERAIYNRGCGACHVIPGVRAARGVVGQSLLEFSQRTFIAGELPNTPDNLVRWLMDPPAVRPATAMPNLGIGTDEARDMAAYLYSLD